MDRSTDKTYLFEQMPASQAVRRQILPAIASQMVLLAYNLADTYFVGLLNDPLQTAAGLDLLAELTGADAAVVGSRAFP